ncbi:MAG: hypothetical protein Pg6C_11510 [Treponemataceae bacterium]|nr:MAG: hypothetical protein Pg6C_11510 [Treponemataceae bacterium]
MKTPLTYHGGKQQLAATIKGRAADRAELDEHPLPPPHEINYQPQYGIIVICDSEKNQEQVYTRLNQSGYKCKVVTV